VKHTYTSAFEEIFGVELVEEEPTDEEWGVFNEDTRPRHTSREWLYMEAPRTQLREGRAVKIAHDVKVVEADHKAGKLIRVRAELKGEEILSVQMRGDFFAIPKEAISDLEEMLMGSRLEEEPLREAVERFYEETGAQIPGIAPGDFSEAIMKVKGLI
jgi:lipoate-protein ligase A